MDRLYEMEVFVAVADAGSLAKAAARLRVSPPAVTRAIAALESRLGARLLNRTTRSLRLTEAGHRFLESARRLLAEVEDAERGAAGEGATPTGHLTITAPVTFGRAVVAPVTTAFLGEHPRITASLLLLDRTVSLVEEGIDVAARIGDLPDSTLVSRKVGEVQRVLVASPGYLARHGEPAAPADLRRHAFVAFTGLMPGREWRFADGETTGRIELRPRLELNDATAAIEAAEAGAGITLAGSYMVAERIAAGRLVPVLHRHATPPIAVQLVHAQSRLVAPKVRAFIEFAAPRLRDFLGRLPAIAEPALRRRQARSARRRTDRG